MYWLGVEKGNVTAELLLADDDETKTADKQQYWKTIAGKVLLVFMYISIIVQKNWKLKWLIKTFI